MREVNCLIKMKEIKITRDLFLLGMSIIYLSAFSSLYHQMPGLYGDSGIMPAHSKIPLEANATTTNEKVDETLSLLWLAPALGIDIPLAIDLLALLGIVISLGCMVWGRMRDMTNFTLLWMLYFSLYQVGQTFMWFQWDILLLEAGFITILAAPLGLLHHKVEGKLLPSLPHRPHDTVTLFLVRWLLFRFMFASGVVKLTSNCPTWWGLTALNFHFESQCIPTSFAWYAHHIPKWLLRLSVVNTFVIEIAVPFLFFMPIRSLRIFSCFIQIFFQISIMLTGNFNFFNLLTITLCVSLMDDKLLLIFNGKNTADSKSTTSAALKYTKFFIFSVIEFVVLFGLAYWTIYFFALKIQPDWTIDSKIAFSPTEFRKALATVMPITIAIGVISLIANILLAFYRSLTEEVGFAKLYNLLGTLCVSFVAIWLFLVSLVPHASLDVKTQRSLWPIINEWYSRVDEFQITNAYGLFRRMTGTNGRPELIIEGSNSLASGWKEYHFLYKPGNIAQRPSFIIPHQPRLDWQMWFAALSSFEHNPWFISFVYRLLEGKQEVLRLLDEKRLPFSASRPPKYIRAVLYKYSYTPLRRINSTANWWTRKRETEYCSTANFDKRQVVDYLKDTGIHLEKGKHMIVSAIFMKRILLKIRRYVESVSATTFIWSLLGTGLSLNFLGPFLRFP